ncbi:hypothetical protein ABS71_12225 [bacterium SCN 62-11]|nr:hypothetical protein [Candidatus Eremiobacteraeota bacterium]ODT65352.1 MAG: hypothetical protein ABS71_12225 [bacterium SCN 62-11]
MNEPQDTDLDELFASATRIELRPVVTLDRLIAPGPLLCEMAGIALGRLRQALELRPPQEPFHQISWGDHTLLFYAEDTLLHGLEVFDFSALRWNGRWTSDSELADDGLALAQLLAELGLPEPLANFEQRRQFLEIERSAQAHWLQAMPPCLTGQRSQPAQLEALHNAYGDECASIRALLHWMGQETSPDPIRMELPLGLLERFAVEDLVAALQRADAQTLRGAWFYLGGHTRLQYIPRPLREAMRSAV